MVRNATDSLIKRGDSHYFLGFCVLLFVLFQGNLNAQEQNKNRFQIDAIAAVVGDYIILDSDIERSFKQLDLQHKEAGIPSLSKCEVAETLYESRLLAHNAKQDSIPFNASEVEAKVEQQFMYMKQQLGSIDKVLEFYKKPDVASFKKELTQINTINSRAEAMRQHIITDVEVSPDQISHYFRNLSEDQIPQIGTTIEFAHLVIDPKPSKEDQQKVINQLNELREDILYNGVSFSSRAVLYSQDPGSSDKGGKYTITRSTPFAKEFKDRAFSLNEGEVSRPFKTDFGWHILTVDKIRGEQVDVRHILIAPQITTASLTEAQQKLRAVRDSISSNQLSFVDAVKRYSDEPETKANEGKLINPITGTTYFEFAKLDPILYSQLEGLKEGQVSDIIVDQDRQGRKKFKLVTLLDKRPAHKADFQQDYIQIQNLALLQKQKQVLQQWKSQRIETTYTRFSNKHCQCNYTVDWCQ